MSGLVNKVKDTLNIGKCSDPEHHHPGTQYSQVLLGVLIPLTVNDIRVCLLDNFKRLNLVPGRTVVNAISW